VVIAACVRRTHHHRRSPSSIFDLIDESDVSKARLPAASFDQHAKCAAVMQHQSSFAINFIVVHIVNKHHSSRSHHSSAIVDPERSVSALCTCRFRPASSANCSSLQIHSISPISFTFLRPGVQSTLIQHPDRLRIRSVGMTVLQMPATSMHRGRSQPCRASGHGKMTAPHHRKAACGQSPPRLSLPLASPHLPSARKYVKQQRSCETHSLAAVRSRGYRSMCA
jgi:hypothetical protein